MYEEEKLIWSDKGQISRVPGVRVGEIDYRGRRKFCSDRNSVFHLAKRLYGCTQVSELKLYIKRVPLSLGNDVLSEWKSQWGVWLPGWFRRPTAHSLGWVWGRAWSRCGRARGAWPGRTSQTHGTKVPSHPCMWAQLLQRLMPSLCFCFQNVFRFL